MFKENQYGYILIKNGVIDADSSIDFLVSPSNPPQRKMRIRETNVDTTNGSSSEVEPQDADYTDIPSLNYELESLILARMPRSEYWKLSFVNKRCLALLKTGEIFKIRREISIKESSVLMAAIGEKSWWVFDREFKNRRKLPVLQADFCFESLDKESFCAGTHLFVCGREFNGQVTWRYELATNRWFKGPCMITPRCLFASATCGTVAFVAGGIGKEQYGPVYDTAEKYNSETKTWDPLPRMKRRRKLCSGCYLDGRFYVIGGRNKDGVPPESNDDIELTCGEYFEEETNRWVLIPDMWKDDPVQNSHSPPLIAVVNNELYSLEASSNQLKVYVKSSNVWKQLGQVPVRADSNRGWGVAFKSLGNELLVMGASSVAPASNSVAMYTCCPDPKAEEELEWRLVNGNSRYQLSDFILNCSVMVA